MGFFGMVLKPGKKEAVEVPPGWCLQLCTAALEPAMVKVKTNKRTSVYTNMLLVAVLVEVAAR